MTKEPLSTQSGGLSQNWCDPERVVNGYRFTCADKADGVTTWPCTGSTHLKGMPEIVCSCECHTQPVSDLTRRIREAQRGGTGEITAIMVSREVSNG